MSGRPLVTGATGFAGSHLLDQLQESGPVAAWGNASGRGLPADARAAIEWRAVDLVDRTAVAQALAASGPTVVYHCAGLPHVAKSWSEPRRALQVNVFGTHHILEGLAQGGQPCPVLVTGSALVYRPSSSPLHEESELGPYGPYALSKLAQEMLASRSPGVPVFIARPFNHAGPRQSADFVTSSFARQIAEIEADKAVAVLSVGNLESQRDITDVRDTVRAYRLIVERGRPGRPYNVCSGRAYRVRDLLDMLLGMARVRVDVVEDAARMRPSDTPLLVGDRSRIGRETGWEPQIPIERTLADLLDYWRRETARAALPAS